MGLVDFFPSMVYVSKERYNTGVRQDTQGILVRHFNSDKEVEFTTYFSESTLARTHYIVNVDNNNIDVNVTAIETDLIEAARSWEDKLYSALSATLGDDLGNRLGKKYDIAFPRSYKEDVFPSSAVVDIEQLEALNDSHSLGMLFYQPQEASQTDNKVRLKYFTK